MSAHTPGPWSWKAGGGKISIVAPHQPDRHLRGMYTIAYTSTRDDKEANARLIAAAPELAEALRELVELKDLKDRDVVFDGDAYQDYAARKPLAWEAARAVLSRLSEDSVNNYANDSIKRDKLHANDGRADQDRTTDGRALKGAP